MYYQPIFSRTVITINNQYRGNKDESKIRVHVKIRNHLEVSVQNSFVLITKYERYFGYLPIIKLLKLRFDME